MDKNTKKLISIEKVFSFPHGKLATNIQLDQNNVDVVNNNEDEIFQATVEMLDSLDSKKNNEKFTTINEKFKKFHIGNICDQRFKDIWKSDKYWEVMNYLASPKFNAQKMCASLCLQHNVNEALDAQIKNKPSSQLKQPAGAKPQHINFI